MSLNAPSRRKLMFARMSAIGDEQTCYGHRQNDAKTQQRL